MNDHIIPQSPLINFFKFLHCLQFKKENINFLLFFPHKFSIQTHSKTSIDRILLIENL